MMERWKSWRRKRIARKKDLADLIRKERADERKIADDHYLKEIAKQRNRHEKAMEELMQEHEDTLKKQRNDIEDRFAKIIVDYEGQIRRMERRLRRAHKAWDMIKDLAYRLLAKSRDAHVNAEVVRDSHAQDYQRSRRIHNDFEALIRTIEVKTPHIEKLLSIKEVREEERQKFVEGKSI